MDVFTNLAFRSALVCGGLCRARCWELAPQGLPVSVGACANAMGIAVLAGRHWQFEVQLAELEGLFGHAASARLRLGAEASGEEENEELDFSPHLFPKDRPPPASRSSLSFARKFYNLTRPETWRVEFHIIAQHPKLIPS